MILTKVISEGKSMFIELKRKWKVGKYGLNVDNTFNDFFLQREQNKLTIAGREFWIKRFLGFFTTYLYPLLVRIGWIML